MMIQIPFRLVNFTVDGVTCVLNSEEARELKKKYPNALVSSYRKGRSLPSSRKPSLCVNIPVEEYLQTV